MSQAKVVELNVEGKRNAPLPPIVHTIRQQSKKQLVELVQHLFNNTDDALFELADRSQSDQHQEMYFYSMRMIRLHRKTLAADFIKAFNESFQKAFNGEADEDEATDAELEAEDYALVSQDELEMNVAVSGIVSKVTSQYSLAVMQLTKRLDFLAKNSTITERTNPLGPHNISTAFAATVGALDMDIKVRIIFMKLFERFVMERLGPIYDTANRALIDAGVLPDMKFTPNAKRRSASPRPTPPTAGSGAVEAQTGPGMGLPGGGAGGTVGFNTVQSLLAGARESGGLGGAAGGAGLGGGGLGAGGSGGGDMVLLPTLESSELIQALSQLQSAERIDRIDIERVPELSDVRSLVLARPGAEEKSLGQSDDDTVNFVGMLFDYILNDRNLAIPMKALIGRLQIPIIKLAVLDKSFFEKTAHPARALLNELSSAGIGWSGAAELKRDALYNKIESVVLRVLNEFAENPDIFSELLHELRAFVNSDKRRSVLVEQRVKESEVGKAKTQEAKLQVQNLVNQKACGLRLPSEAGKFISHVWTRVLTLRIVKNGEQSTRWAKGVQTLDDLLWALQPLSDLDAVEERETKAPGLLEEVVEGMEELGCPADEVAEFTAWLTKHLQDLTENDRAYLVEDERPDLDIAEEVVEEIVLTTTPSIFDESKVSDQCKTRLKLIHEGTWVEIRQDEERLLRCKLATITQPGDHYVFVNRRGMKVLEKSKGELAELIDSKQLKLIDESQVFDRALQSVIGNLRQMQRQRSS